MFNVFKKFAIGAAILLVAVVVVALLMPSKWRVERSVTIAAPPERIHPFVGDLKQWERWVPFSKPAEDSDAKWTYSEPSSGEGATMQWKGTKSGAGAVKITGSSPTSGIRYEMALGDGQPSRGEVRYEAVPEGTRVTWIDEGSVGHFLPGRFFISMIERVLGEHFDRALATLKRISEEPPPGG